MCLDNSLNTYGLISTEIQVDMKSIYLKKSTISMEWYSFSIY